MTMRNLPPLLESIPHIKHSIYADDITIWTNSGSDGEITEALQAAADTRTKFCATEWSSVLADKIGASRHP